MKGTPPERERAVSLRQKVLPLERRAVPSTCSTFKTATARVASAGAHVCTRRSRAIADFGSANADRRYFQLPAAGAHACASRSRAIADSSSVKVGRAAGSADMHAFASTCRKTEKRCVVTLSYNDASLQLHKGRSRRQVCRHPRVCQHLQVDNRRLITTASHTALLVLKLRTVGAANMCSSATPCKMQPCKMQQGESLFAGTCGARWQLLNGHNASKVIA